MDEQPKPGIVPQPCRACGYDLGRVVLSHCPECGADRTSWVNRWDVVRVRLSLALLVWALPLLVVGVAGAAVSRKIADSQSRVEVSIIDASTFLWCLIPALAGAIGVYLLHSAFHAKRWARCVGLGTLMFMLGLFFGADGYPSRSWIGLNPAGSIVLVSMYAATLGALAALVFGMTLCFILGRSIVRLGCEHGVNVRIPAMGAVILLAMAVVGTAASDIWETATTTRRPGYSTDRVTGLVTPFLLPVSSFWVEPYARVAAGLGIVGLWGATLLVRAKVLDAGAQPRTREG